MVCLSTAAYAQEEQEEVAATENAIIDVSVNQEVQGMDDDLAGLFEEEHTDLNDVESVEKIEKQKVGPLAYVAVALRLVYQSKLKPAYKKVTGTIRSLL